MVVVDIDLVADILEVDTLEVDILVVDKQVEMELEGQSLLELVIYFHSSYVCYLSWNLNLNWS